MKVEQIHIDKIKTDFNEMQSKDDLLILMNFAKQFIYGKKSVLFDLKQLTWYSNPKLSKVRYTTFKIKKKSGAERTINAPMKGLKAIQRVLSFIFQCVYEPNNAAFGFVRNKSIVDNAKLHQGSRYVYNIDLKDFFSSIDQARVWKCLQLSPFNLNASSNRIKPEINEASTFKYYKATEHTAWPNESNNFLGLIYSGFYLKEGSNKLQLKSGGTIFYKVNLNNDKQSGEIYVYVDKSEFNSIIELAKKKSQEENQDFEATLNGILLNLIAFHSNKMLEKDSRSNIANILASLCCTEMEVERMNETGEWETVKRNVLPQGAPTSPVITNVICQRLDYILSGVAKRFGLIYSRYADDITFSSMHNVYQENSAFLIEIKRVITEQGFYIKASKTRLQKEGYRKEVTGLLVNEKVNVQKKYIKQLRMWLYYWETYGYEKAYSYFFSQYIFDKGHIKNGNPNMENIISGKLDYLKMVKSADNELFLKLKKRYDNLTTTNIKPKTNSESEITTKIDTNQIRITLEVNQSPEKNEKLNNSINIPKDTLLPSTIIVSNSIDIKDAEKNRLINLYPIDHSPIKTVELLKYFTANDKDLKYSTHSWEEGKYDGYDDYIGKIKTEWDSIYYSPSNMKFSVILKRQSNRLHAKISNFLFNNKLGQKNEKGFYYSWGEKSLKFGWASPELKIHMDEPGNSPFSCPIPNHIKNLDNKHSLLYFKDYADIFKNEIEFREDSNNFKTMVMDLWKEELTYDFDIKGIKDLVGFSFFTDVNYIKESIRMLFRDLFKTKPEFPEIIIMKQSHFENEGYHLIRITQKDSFVTREIDDPKFTRPTGNLHSIIMNLKNLADYSVISRFADGKNYRINYLTSSENLFIEKLEIQHEVLGFTHEFKFYL